LSASGPASPRFNWTLKFYELCALNRSLAKRDRSNERKPADGDNRPPIFQQFGPRTNFIAPGPTGYSLRDLLQIFIPDLRALMLWERIQPDNGFDRSSR